MGFLSLSARASITLLAAACSAYALFWPTSHSLQPPSDDDDNDDGEEPQDSSDEDISDEEGGPHIPEDEGGDEIFTDQEEDSYDSEVVPDQGSDASGGGDGVRKQRGRKIPIPNQPPPLVIFGGPPVPAGEASDGEVVEQKVTNQESLIGPLVEAPPEEDATERSGNSWPFKTEAARRGEKWRFRSDGADVPFLVKNWNLQLPEVPTVNPISQLVGFHRQMTNMPAVVPPLMIPNFDPPQPPVPLKLRLPPQSDFTGGSRVPAGKFHSPTTEQQGDRNEGDDDSLEIEKILNPDPQPSLHHTSSLPTPSDFTGGNRVTAGKDSPKTEHEGDRNHVGKFQNINPQAPLSGTLPIPRQSGGSSIPPSGNDLPEADQERDITELGDNFQKMATIQHSNPPPPLSATLPAPPPADYTGGSSAGAQDWPEAEQERDGSNEAKRQKLN